MLRPTQPKLAMFRPTQLKDKVFDVFEANQLGLNELARTKESLIDRSPLYFERLGV